MITDIDKLCSYACEKHIYLLDAPSMFRGFGQTLLSEYFALFISCIDLREPLHSPTFITSAWLHWVEQNVEKPMAVQAPHCSTVAQFRRSKCCLTWHQTLSARCACSHGWLDFDVWGSCRQQRQYQRQYRVVLYHLPLAKRSLRSLQSLHSWLQLPIIAQDVS